MKHFILFLSLLIIGFVSPNITKVQAAEQQVLTQTWHLSGNNGAAEAYQTVNSNILYGQDKIRITYDLHGLCALPGDASAVIFDQSDWKYISLSNYGKNCFNGSQTVEIPLSDFKNQLGQSLNSSTSLTGSLHTRFWYNQSFTVDFQSITVLNSQSGSITPTPTVKSTNYPTPTPTVIKNSLFGGISNGAAVSGIINVSYNAPTTTTKKVDFYIDNALKTTESYAPYYLGGDHGGTPIGWDTKQLANAQHSLKANVTRTDGTIYSESIVFTVNNGGATIPTPTPTIKITVTPTPSNNPNPTPTPTTPVSVNRTWTIQSVDAMKDTKDAVCGQRSESWITSWVNKAVELGATHVALSVPYENPSCGDARAFEKLWIKVIRSKGLKVWHRQMPLAFEGIYSATKTSQDFLTTISNYIKNNPDNYQDGDIFTPIPEPQNGGISGITYCANNYCQFSSKEQFNQWLRDAMTVSKNAFSTIGKTGIKVGYFGFDGFVAWGSNNPDWHGILEDSTIAAMGNITIDHYPELIGSTMQQGLDELVARYPGVDIVIGEWGSADNKNVEQEVRDTMGAAKNHPAVKGFNYWQFGPSGAGEQLINDDFSNRIQFDDVQKFYKGL